jgi:hypothetical protein
MLLYAIAHTYGGNIRRGDNRRMGLVVAFQNSQARDAWCEAGPACRRDYRYREPLAPDDPDIAYFRRNDGIVDAADLGDPRLADWL